MVGYPRLLGNNVKAVNKNADAKKNPELLNEEVRDFFFGIYQR